MKGKFAARFVAFVMTVGAVGCSGASNDPQVVAPTPEPEPTPTETSVAEPTPSVVPTVVVALDDAGLASITGVAAGEPVEDAIGNLVTIHGLVVPDPVLGDIGDHDLFDDLEDVFSRGPVGLVDVSWCAPGPHLETQRASVALSLAASDDAPLDQRSMPDIAHPLVEPAFVFPEPGTCRRGLAPVQLPTSRPRVARLALSVDDGPSEHLYQWDLAPAEVVSPDAQAGAARLGQAVRFNEGPLAESTVVFNGWAERFDAVAPTSGTRVVSVAVEICPASDAWPALGLAIEGWNLLGPIDPSAPLGPGASEPAAGSCVDGWADFAVPLGLEPSGFFVSDGVDAISGYATWSLEGAAVAPPE